MNLDAYQKVFEHAPNPIAILDEKFDFISVNKLYAQAGNKEISEFLGHNHFELYPSPDNEKIFLEVVKSKKAYSTKARAFTYKEYRERGVTYWDWSLTPVLDSTNKVELLVLSLINVTEQIESEKALNMSEELFNTAFRLNPNLMFIRRLEDDNYITANDAFLRIIGYNREEFSGLSELDLNVWTHRDEELKFTNKLKKQRFVHNFEMSFETKTKGQRKGLISAEIVNIHNQPCILGVITDVTEAISAKDRLNKLTGILESSNEELQQEIIQRKYSEAHLKAIFDNSTLGIITSAIDGKVLQYNAALVKMLGYSQEELCSMTCERLTHPEDIRKNQDKVIEVFQGKRDHYEMEKRFLKKDGSILWANLTLVFAESANIRFVISFLQDITEKKQYQDQMVKFDRLNLIGEMASGISHEVRNPMTTVRGFLQILRSKKDFYDYMDYFDLMIEELDRSNAIITEFLSIGRNTPTNLQKENLNSIVESLRPLIEASAFRKDNYLEIETSKVSDLLLNSKEIRQVLLNLCQNGLDAMPEGGTLKIETFCQGGEVILAVQDEGEGIKPDVLDKLGTPFFTTKDNGTGLGLGVCYSIAARHNADISLKTGPKGTTFYVKFKVDNMVSYNKMPVNGQI